MKKMFFLTFVFVVFFLTTGCDSISVADVLKAIEGTGLISPSDLPSSEADFYPQSQVDAISLYKGAMDAFADELWVNSSPASYSTKSTDSQETSLDWSGAWVSITGFANMEFTYPDEGFRPESYGNYEDLYAMALDLEYQGIIDGLTVNGAANSYTMNGYVNFAATSIQSEDYSFGIDVETDATMNMDYSIAMNADHALSICRDDGLGAKILLYYSVLRNQQDEEATFAEGQIAIYDDISAWIENLRINMKVYDDANELISDYSIPIMDVNSMDLLSEYSLFAFWM